MLTSYVTRTQQILQNPAAASSLYATSDLTSYVNTARAQVAGEGACIRVMGSLPLTTSAQSYPFSSINVSGTAGVGGVLNVRGATVGVASGQAWLTPRAFPYFQLYFLNNPVPPSGTPTDYSQYGQGATGSLYFNVVPDAPYVVTVDCVCQPIPLVDDTTAEAIPYPWTDAVPYFAAWLAYVSAQRNADADHMWQIYQTFMQRARQMSNGEVVPQQFAQAGSPVRAGQLGTQQSEGQ